MFSRVNSLKGRSNTERRLVEEANLDQTTSLVEVKAIFTLAGEILQFADDEGNDFRTYFREIIYEERDMSLVVKEELTLPPVKQILMNVAEIAQACGSGSCADGGMENDFISRIEGNFTQCNRNIGCNNGSASGYKKGVNSTHGSGSIGGDKGMTLVVKQKGTLPVLE